MSASRRTSPAWRDLTGLIFCAKNVIFKAMSADFSWPIFGHKNQLKFLQDTLRQGHLANTYLFYGPSGLGKKMIADYFAQSLFCQGESAKPCGHCQNCRLISRGTFLDLYKLGYHQDLSIDNVREFLHSLSLSNVSGQRKLAIIYGVHTINLFSANALLKTLEEPPKNTTIILIADSIVNLPATVISRAQLLKFKSLSRSDMEAWLANYDFNQAEKETIINLSFGKPGVALKMMADNLGTFKNNSDFIIKLLASNTFNYMQAIDKWFELLKKDYAGYKVYELGNLTRDYLDLFEVFLRDLLWLKLNRPIVAEIYHNDLQKIAREFRVDSLVNNLLSLYKIRQKLSYNVSPQLLWENLLLSVK